MVLYKITNKVNGNSYVGFTTQPIKNRFSSHVYSANTLNKPWPIARAIRKYGRENFTIKTIYEGKDAYEQEDKYIKMYGHYNVQPGGQKGSVTLGSKRTFTKEWKENISKAAIERAKRENRSETMSGKGNYMYGKIGIGAKERIYKGKVYTSLRDMCNQLSIAKPTAYRYLKKMSGGI